MKLKILILINIFTIGGFAAPNSISKKNKISYVISPNIKDPRTLDVIFSFKGDASGQTRIKHTKIWAGNDYEKDFTNFKVTTPGARLKARKGHPKDINKVIEHKPSEKISLKYSVRSHVEVADGNYKPMIRKNYFHMIGQSFLMVPENENSNDLYEISLEFKGFPKEYKFANSFFANNSKNSFTAQIDDFLYGVFVGGDFRVKKMNVKNKPLYVAIRGEWEFADKGLFETIYNIVAYQRDFFKDHSFKHFLITMIPNGRGCCSAGGTGLTDSFASFFPKDAKLGEHLKFLLSHELFHTWNGKVIKRVEPEELVYWFSEGFTDYYSRLLLLRAGEITLEQFVEDYNSALYRYYTSSAINARNKKILKDFWKNKDVEKLPYQRGNILARKWNAEIKRKSKGRDSFDKILFDFFNEAKLKNTKVSKESFVRIASKYVEGGFAKDIKKYIEKGVTLTPGEHDLGPCVKRKEVLLGKFDHGYDSKKTYQTNIITGLKKRSEAYRAGLRNGDKMVGREIHFPPTKMSWIEVLKKNNVRKKIHFLPIDKKKRKGHQFEIDRELFKSNPEKCLSWFR